jgi:putative flippase GtrA
MNRKFVIFAALAAAFAFATQSAQAGGYHHDKRKLAAVAIGVGAASTAGFFALNNWRWSGWNTNGSAGGLTRLGAYGVTTMGCAAVSPMVATVVLQRQLTMREAHTLIGSCVVPIVGGLLVDAIWQANPQWEAGQPVHHRHARKHKK